MAQYVKNRKVIKNADTRCINFIGPNAMKWTQVRQSPEEYDCLFGSQFHN